MRDRGRRSTPAGEHRPVLLDEVLAALAPVEGNVIVDCTTGWAGHSAELLRRVGSNGRLIGLDLDPENLPRARERLTAVGFPFTLHHSNFAALPTVLAEENMERVDAVLADLGMSSMQVDDAERGFSYVPTGRSTCAWTGRAADPRPMLLTTISEEELARACATSVTNRKPSAWRRCSWKRRGQGKLRRTVDVSRVSHRSGERRKTEWRLHPAPGKWNLHPAARTFQALRILVNRELGNLRTFAARAADDPSAGRPRGDHQLSQRRRPIGKVRVSQGDADWSLSGSVRGADPTGIHGAHGQPTFALERNCGRV